MIALWLAAALAAPCEAVQARADALDAPHRCATGGLFHLEEAIAAAPSCATRSPVARRGVDTPAPRWRDGTVDKAVRDAWGEYPNQLTSENFALKWGVDATFSTGQAQVLLDALEASWDLSVGERGYAPPFGADAFKINAYVGDTGSDTPSALGAAGYYWFDDEGWPMLVFSKDVLPEAVDTEMVAAHEFFHALQDANGEFAYDEVSGWWWEATAVWHEHEVYPEHDLWPVFLYWFSIRPELWIGHFVYPRAGSPEEYHQYGAFVYASHLAERHGGHALIKASFDRSSARSTPLRVLDTLLTERGEDLAESFGVFAARNATWDYPEEAWFEQWIDAYEGAAVPHRPTGTVFRETPDWVGPTEHLPRTFGANYWRLTSLRSPTRVEFEGGPDTRWHVAVATQDGAAHEVVPIPVVDGVGELWLEEVEAVDERWLVVAATGPLSDEGAEYAYRLRVTDESEIPVTPEEPRACGCAAGGGPGGAAWGGLALLLGLRVRRRVSRRS